MCLLRANALVRCAGKWRGLEVAIKTVVFSSGGGGCDEYTQLVASEAAIASNLSHENIVSTYSHDIVEVQKTNGPENGIYKFYLIQVCHSTVHLPFHCVACWRNILIECSVSESR